MTVVLPGPGQLRIRPLHQSEPLLIHDLYARLSPRTRYLRFFSATPVLAESAARLLLGTSSSPALVAECETRGRREAVGLASFGAVDQETAEVGLVVQDDWQRRRIGTTLAWRVLETAEASGVRRFVAHVLFENDAVFRLLRTLRVHVSAVDVSGGVAVVRFGRRP